MHKGVICSEDKDGHLVAYYSKFVIKNLARPPSLFNWQVASSFTKWWHLNMKYHKNIKKGETVIEKVFWCWLISKGKRRPS